MKKYVLYFIIVFIFILVMKRSVAQVTILINQPQSIQVKVSDIFNADIINLSSKEYSLYFVGTIINLKSGGKFVESKTQNISFPVGTKHINEGLLLPSYRYNSSITEQTGYLPYGNYQLCLYAYSIGDNEERGSACINVEVTPLSPPILLSPENGSSVSTNYPLLIWLSPAPINNGMNVLYDLKLVELSSNQTAYDAIQRNFAVFEDHNLHATNLQYPVNAIKLEEGKSYAWKILAKTFDGTFIGETEVWTFKYSLTLQQNEGIADDDYVEIANSTLSNNYIEVSKFLRFTYKEEYLGGTLLFKVTEMMDNKDIKISDEFLKKTGDNKFTLKLDNRFKKDRFYTIEVTNSKKEKRILIFKIK